MNIHTFIIAYFSVAVAVHFIPPLSIYLKKEFGKIYLEYQNASNETYKNNLKIDFALLGIVTFISVLIFPITIIFRVINKNKSQDSIEIETNTRQFFDPSSNCLIEEQDYEIISSKITQIRKYSYNTYEQLIESVYLDGKGTWICTRKNYYNSESFLFHETYNHKDSTADSRSFHVLDSLGRPVETYGELGTGHKYQHSFLYDSNGEQHLTARFNLARHFDLQELYENNLREREEAERLRQKHIADEKERLIQEQAEQVRRVQQAKAAEREREIAQKVKQEEETRKKQLAEEERQRREEIQAIEKARRVIEESNSSIISSPAPKREEPLIECNTAYSERVLNTNNPSFVNFREIAKLTAFQWENDYRDQLWRRLQNGVAILTDEDELAYYFFSYGQMHQAKLNDAFTKCIHPTIFSGYNSTINIIDYGCGQALASICLMDYVQARGISNFKITKITLIEPSQKALMRGALHSKCVAEHLSVSPTLITIKKLMDEVSHEDLSTDSTSIKIHLFSNILDVTTFDLLSLAKKIGSTQKGINYFICVSPTYGTIREARMNAFFEYFQNHNRATLISERSDDVQTSTGPKKRQEKIFKVQFN